MQLERILNLYTKEEQEFLKKVKKVKLHKLTSSHMIVFFDHIYNKDMIFYIYVLLLV